MMLPGDELGQGCIIPLAQASVTGVLLGLLTLGVGLWAGWNDPGLLALAVGAGAAVVWWLTSIVNWRRSVYGETLPVFEPPHHEERQAVRVEVRQDDGRSMQFADLPADLEQLTALGAGLIGGASFSEGSWTGSGRPFSRSQFQAIRAEFLKRGWAVWTREGAPSQGVRLTHAGRAVARRFASMTTSPTLDGNTPKKL